MHQSSTVPTLHWCIMLTPLGVYQSHRVCIRAALASYSPGLQECIATKEHAAFKHYADFKGLTRVYPLIVCSYLVYRLTQYLNSYNPDFIYVKHY